jgi:molecular chaperone GrpE
MKDQHKAEQAFDAGEEININADSEIPGTTHLSNPESEPSSETEKLEQALSEQKDKFLRLSAEFDNFRRRTARERIELEQLAAKNTITSLLETLDDAERAEKQMQQTDDINVVREGSLLVFHKLRNALQQKGLKPMETIGQDFDVEKHEAITEVPAGPEMQGKVVDEVVKGYYLNDKLIRFAKVVVGK